MNNETENKMILPNDVYDKFVEELQKPAQGPNEAMLKLFQKAKKLRQKHGAISKIK